MFPHIVNISNVFTGHLEAHLSVSCWKTDKVFCVTEPFTEVLRQNGGIRQWHIYQEPQCLHVGLDVSTSRYHAPRKTSTSNDQQALKFGHQARPGNSALVERTDSRVSRFSNAIAKFQAAQAYGLRKRLGEFTEFRLNLKLLAT